MNRILERDDPGAMPGEGSALHRFVWRWHFFAGLMVAPVVIMLAATGALYLYGDEIESVLYADVIEVTPVDGATSAGVQQAAVLSAYPGGQVIRFTLPERPGRAAEWMITTASGDVRTVMVDPADARITGSLDTASRLTTVLGDLHGELMMGRAGDLIVELASCWTVVLLVTGVFLWWPRQRRLAGVMWPRFGSGGRRILRDLHAVPSIWNLPVILFLLLTGLPWSGFWGENLARLGTLSSEPDLFAPTPNFTAPPAADGASSQRLEEHVHAGDLPWSIRQATLPAVRQDDAGTGVDADTLMRVAAERGIDQAGLRVIYPSGPGGVFTLSYVPDRAEAQRTVHINPADGRILQDIGWDGYSALGKTVEFGVIVHMGRQFGEINRIILLASCLVLIATVCFGIATWWRRRPPGRLAAPPRSGLGRPAVVLPVAVVLGLLFPLAGLSMAGFALLDWSVGRMRRT